jgi:hypothetical protein
MFKSLLMVFAISLFGCSSRIPFPFNVTMLVDCSSSMSGSEQAVREEITEVGRWWARQAMRGDGGSFEVLIIGRDIDDLEILFSAKCPDSFGAPLFESKKKWMNGFAAALQEAAVKMPSDGGSAVIEGILRASFRLSETGGEKTLIILSDLREVSSDINFERSVPDKSVVECWLSKHCLAPNLGDIRVMCVGFKPYPPNANTSKISSEEYVKLRGLWLSLFESWGARAKLTESFNPENPDTKGGLSK